MSINKTDILSKICYTELVYERVNKKLKMQFSITEIEVMLCKIIDKTEILHFNKIGKNIYVINAENQIKITINSNTHRIITVDKIKS